MTTFDAITNTPIPASVPVDSCPCPELHLPLTMPGNSITTGNGVAAIVVDPLQGGNSTLLDLLTLNGPLPDTATIFAGRTDPVIYLFSLTGPLSSRLVGPGLTLLGEGGSVPAPGLPTLTGGTYRYRDAHALAPLPLRWRVDWNGLGLTDTKLGDGLR